MSESYHAAGQCQSRNSPMHASMIPQTVWHNSAVQHLRHSCTQVQDSTRGLQAVCLSKPVPCKLLRWHCKPSSSNNEIPTGMAWLEIFMTRLRQRVAHRTATIPHSLATRASLRFRRLSIRCSTLVNHVQRTSTSDMHRGYCALNGWKAPITFFADFQALGPAVG